MPELTHSDGTEAPGLFDLPDGYTPPVPPEELSRAERRKALIAARINRKVHPLGEPVFLHSYYADVNFFAKPGPTCGGCRFRVTLRHHNKTYPKCWWPDTETYPHPRDSHSDASDIRAWWPACGGYQPKGDE